MAADIALPDRIVAHGHWTVEGAKMSKSLSNSVDPAAQISMYGADSLRYFLLRASRLDADADFSPAAATKTHNSELANQLGNLLSRALAPAFLHHLPAAEPEPEPAHEASSALVALVREAAEAAGASFDACEFNLGIDRMLLVLHEANRRFSEAEPWCRLAAGDTDGVRRALIDTAFAVQAYAIVMQPVLPGACRAVLDALRVGPASRGLEHIRRGCVDLGGLAASASTCRGLFPRLGGRGILRERRRQRQRRGGAQTDDKVLLWYAGGAGRVTAADYCDIFLTHDAPRVRKDHNAGWKHAVQVRAHFLGTRPAAVLDCACSHEPGGDAAHRRRARQGL